MSRCTAQVWKQYRAGCRTPSEVSAITGLPQGDCRVYTHMLVKQGLLAKVGEMPKWPGVPGPPSGVYKPLDRLSIMHADSINQAMATSRQLLTARQNEVLDCLLSGYAHKETADELSLAISTVKNHALSIRRTLQIPKDVYLRSWAKTVAI